LAGWPKPVPLLAESAVAIDERSGHYGFGAGRWRARIEQLLIANHEHPLGQSRKLGIGAFDALDIRAPEAPPMTWALLNP